MGVTRFPGMAGEGSDAVSAYTTFKIVDTLKLPENECSGEVDQNPSTTRGKEVGTTLTILWVFWNEICMVTLWQAFF